MNRNLSLLVLAALASGCASSTGGGVKSTGPAGKVDEARVNAVYAELERGTTSAEEAFKRAADGDAAGAAAALVAARETLAAAGGKCVATPGCEIERVLAAQDALIQRQARELIGQDEAVAPVEESAAPEAGAAASTVAGTLPQAARSVSLLKGKDLRTIIRLNEPVKAALEEWLTWMRPNLLEAYENYQYLRHRMWPVYSNAGLPEALLFGILAKESGGKVHAVSRAGASGPLQFMPHTGVRYGLTSSAGFDLRFDPTAATRANVAYLNDRFRELNDNLELALGAYNGGEGRMRRLSPDGRRSFWDPAVWNSLPPETRDYVPMVLAAAWLFLHPEQYNLKFPAVDARPAQITLASSLSLSELSVCMGQEGNARGWFRTLRNLNPRHDANLRLAPGTVLHVPQTAVAAYSGNCMGGRYVAAAKELHDANMPAAPVFRAAAARRTHVVRRGETLSAIARKFGCQGIGPIAQANRIKPPRYSIRPGQRLVVPGCGA